MRTETVEIDERFGKDYEGKYVFQEISWAKRNRIIQKHTKYHPVTGQVVRSDYVAIQAETIMASLKEQPETKPITLEKLLSETDGVPIKLGELLSKETNKVCGLTGEEEKNLSGPSEKDGPTPTSQSSESAKSSGGHQTSSENSQPKQYKSSL